MSKNGDSEVDFTNEARDRSPKKTSKNTFPILATGMERYIMVHLATPQKDLIAQNSEKLDAKSPSHDSPPPHLAIAQSGGIFPWIS